MNSYDYKKIELKWRNYWEEKEIYALDLKAAKNPFYNLMMFPYPSAEGMHIGSMYTYTGVDTYGRFKRMQGYDVFEPIGLDAFGIHSENYALKIGEHIKTVSERTHKHFVSQLKMMGNIFDWSNFLSTCDADYYKWTQWLFVQFFKSGLAYRKNATVKYCPSCKTVVSDEQVIGGKCERCNHEVENKDLEQWFFKITNYAGRLYDNLEKLDWDKIIVTAQKEWINKKNGTNIEYIVNNLDYKINCFTTRPDTNFGATFIVLAAEHDFVNKIINKEIKVTDDKYERIKNYVAETKAKSDIERIAEGREKTGVFTGFYAKNRLNGKDLPIYVSDFVLMNFGTGAVVGVPGHDKRDFEFAQAFNLDVIRVVKNGEYDGTINDKKDVFEDDGICMNSEFLNGLKTKEAISKVNEYIVENGFGKVVTNYNLRDWCVSRQRYWGPPIPMIYCEECAKKGLSWFNTIGKKEVDEELLEEMKGWYPVEELPVKLPDIADFNKIKPDGSGRGPLASQEDFVQTECPYCKARAKRETDVLDPFVDSCWYFLRYPFSKNSKIPFGGDFLNNDTLFKSELSDEELIENLNIMKKWFPVNVYIGGREHAVLHLLYARFVTMVFKDLGYIDFEEPFTKMIGHGLITKDGAKMSKSKGNIVNPDELIDKYGVDVVRLYLRFIGPFTANGDWRDSGIAGMSKFVKKLFGLFMNYKDIEVKGNNYNVENSIQILIKEATNDYEELKFNTLVAKIMEFVNEYTENVTNISIENRIKCLETLAVVIAPMAPFISEEMWEILGHSGSIHNIKWPKYDKEKAIKEIIILPVQVNGKVRGNIEIQRGETEGNIVKFAKEHENIKKYLNNGEIKKVIFIQDKIINFVV